MHPRRYQPAVEVLIFLHVGIYTFPKSIKIDDQLHSSQQKSRQILNRAMDIIIVGAGIAGLGAGIGLRRAGHNVTVGIHRTLTVALTSNTAPDSRTIITVKRSRSRHLNQAQRLAGPPVVGLYPGAVRHGCHTTD